MNNSVLIIGKNSFVASGVDEVLKKHSFEVTYFSRGSESKTENVVYGYPETIVENSFFSNHYDYVINYVVIKDKSIQANLDYINQLLEFCKKRQVQKLIHFSSIMVYNYAEKIVTEETPIEPLCKTVKKGYGEIKIAVDEYLLSVKDQYDFEIVLVRPGYVLDQARACPFIKNLPLGFSLIKGNKKSKQPIIKKELIHEALLKIIKQQKNNFIYHLFPNDNMTKYQFAKEQGNHCIIIMPKIIFKKLPNTLCKLKVLPKSIYSRFEGMYIETNFSSKTTEKKLNIKF